jgi:hypothetical protein
VGRSTSIEKRVGDRIIGRQPPDDLLRYRKREGGVVKSVLGESQVSVKSLQ